MNSEISITQLLAILNVNREALSLMDDKFKPIYRTNSAEEMTGWTIEERRQNDGLDKTHPDDLDMLKKQREEVLLNPSKPISAIFRTLHKNGKYIWIKTVMTNLLHDKSVCGIVCKFENITVTKDYEEKQMLYHSIVDSSDDIILSKNLDGIITGWNKSAEKEFGYTSNEIIGKHISILIPTYLQNEEVDILKKVKSGLSIERYETKRITKSGNIIDVSLTISPIKDFFGNIVGASKISRNITQRKKAAEDILKINRLYTFLSAINQCIVYTKDEMQLLNKCQKIAVELGNFIAADIGILNDDGILISINSDNFKKKVPVLQKFSGKDFSIAPLNKTPTGKALFSGLFSICNDVSSDPDLIIWKEELINKGIRSCASYSIKRFGKTIGVFNFYSSEINFFDENEIALLNEAVNDISFTFELFEKERLHFMAVKAMEKSEANYRSIMQQAGDAILVSDKKGNCLDANPSFLQLTGYCTKDILALTLQDLIPEIDLSNQKKQIKRLLAGENVIIEIIIRKKDGGFVLTEMNANKASDGRLLAIFRDITERKNAEKKLTDVNRMYAFISQINQMIVHSENEDKLYEKACRIATEVGKFKAAWIGIINSENKTNNLVAQSGLLSEDLDKFVNVSYDNKGMLVHVMQNNTYYVCNDAQKDLQLDHWKIYAKQRGYGSAMVLPIRKNGVIIAAFSLFAAEIEFFDKKEIALLEEAVGDISFALDIFEKEKLHKIAEQKVKATVERLNQAQKISHV